jgi:signal transduction histidine kinase
VAALAWAAGPSAAAEAAPAAAPRIGQPLHERKVLTVGVATDSFPYSYLDRDGRLTGFGCDLLNALCRVMNLRIERVARPSRQVQAGFHMGEYDLLQSLSQTEEREGYAEFSVPYLTLQGALFVQKTGSPIRSLADLNGRPFAVIGASSIAEKFLRDHDIRIETVYVSSTAEGLGLVESGRCAATFASQLTALTVINHDGFRNIAMFQDPFPDYDIRHCFAVHRGDAQLLARLNEGLAILHGSGEFDRIYNHWFGYLNSPLISRQQVVSYSLVALAAAFLLALLGLLHQRKLRHQIAGQAAELAGQQALLQTLYDNIPLAVCVLEATPEGHRILIINRQAEPYFGALAAQVAGRRLADLAPGSEWIAGLSALLHRGLAERRHRREEHLLPTARQHLIFTLVPMSPGPAGQARLCVLAEDVTDRRNLDEEIAQSRKLRAVGELVGGIAHEFNNLLTPILLKVGEIRLHWAHDAALVGEIQLITQAVQRSAELTRRLLTFGRKADHRRELVTLATVIGNCFSLLRQTMERRIAWEQDVPPDLPPIFFSATDLNQIILNLVLNARDTLLEKLAARRGEWTPLIRVEVRLLPAEASGHADGSPSARTILGWQRLTIRDNGMGITPDVRERIFEPFFTTKDVGQGTGLGLATVWHLVTEASGRIEVESIAGEGSAFHVYLPMLPATEAAPEPVPPAAPAESRLARILLAEDDPLVATAVSIALKRAGHTVTHFTEGAAAWQHLQAQLPDYDLLLLDVNMPGLDGIELARRVRATGRFPGRIMISSGRLGSDDLPQIAAARVDRILNKPFAVAELLAAVNDCLAAPRRD